MTILQPVQPAERQPLLDILRGFALLGVVVSNYSYIADTFDGEARQWVFTHFHLFTAYALSFKSYSLLSFLFGYGFGLLLDNLRRNSPQPGRVFARRMVWLFLIGVANSLIWDGDILKTYAFFGLLLWLCRDWSVRWQVRVGISLLLLNVGWRLWTMFNPLFPDSFSDAYNDAFVAAYQGSSLTEYIRFNVWAFYVHPGSLVNMLTDVSIPGLMLLGLAGSRAQLLSDWERHKALLKKLCIWGGIIGIAFGILSWVVIKSPDLKLESPWLELRRVLGYQTFNRYGLMAFYLGGFAWLYHSGKRWVQVFAPVGRMALTNYLVQSLCLMLAFSGAFFGGASRLQLWSFPLVGFAVFLMQLIYSPLWLRRFRYGPVEWVWRRLVYGKLFSETKTSHQPSAAD